MHLIIKGSSNKVFEVDVDDEATVLDLKNKISEAQSDIAASSIRLIYSGKVLSDSNTLKSYDLKDGHSIHMVVAKSRPSTVRTPSSGPTTEEMPVPPPQPQAQPNSNPMPNFAGLNGMDPLSMFGGFDMNSMNQLINSPLFTNMMDQMIDNPEILSQMLANNPLFANNPMMQSIASNPEMFRQQLIMMRQMRNQGATNNPANPPNPGAQPNPFDFSQFMNSPMFQQALQMFQQNPSQYIDMIRNNPMFANNPMFNQLLNDPELLNQEMQAISSMFGGGGNNYTPPPAQNTNQATTTQAPPNTANPFSALLNPPQPAQTNTNNVIDPVLLQHLLESPVHSGHQALLNNAEVQRGLRLVQEGIYICRQNHLMLFNNVPNIDQIVAQHRPAQPQPSGQFQMSPEQRFGTQLSQLHEMGFNDDQRNIQALIATQGNLDRTVDWLMNH